MSADVVVRLDLGEDFGVGEVGVLAVDDAVASDLDVEATDVLVVGVVFVRVDADDGVVVNVEVDLVMQAEES